MMVLILFPGGNRRERRLQRVFGRNHQRGPQPRLWPLYDNRRKPALPEPKRSCHAATMDAAVCICWPDAGQGNLRRPLGRSAICALFPQLATGLVTYAYCRVHVLLLERCLQTLMGAVAVSLRKQEQRDPSARHCDLGRGAALPVLMLTCVLCY